MIPKGRISPKIGRLRITENVINDKAIKPDTERIILFDVLMINSIRLILITCLIL